MISNKLSLLRFKGVYGFAQSTHRIAMVTPDYFGFNEMTSQSNVFQKTGLPTQNIRNNAIKQWNHVKKALQNKGIEVLELNGPQNAPDAIFPNWFTTFPDKTMDLFAMEAPNRKIEKTKENIDRLSKEYKLLQDFTDQETKGNALESTSCLVLDRVNNIAYCSVSTRADPRIALKWANKRNFTIQFFISSLLGKPIYHTNVVMWIGSKVCALGADVIQDQSQVKRLENSLLKYRKIVHFSKEQIMNYCGNMIELSSKQGDKYLLMSKTSLESLNQEQIRVFNESFRDFIVVDLQYIQNYGGGSARCLIQELY